jgi:hypothetical protein
LHRPSNQGRLGAQHKHEVRFVKARTAAFIKEPDKTMFEVKVTLNQTDILPMWEGRMRDSCPIIHSTSQRLIGRMDHRNKPGDDKCKRELVRLPPRPGAGATSEDAVGR